MKIFKHIKRLFRMDFLSKIFSKKENSTRDRVLKNIKIDINNLPKNTNVSSEQQQKIYSVMNRAFQAASK